MLQMVKNILMGLKIFVIRQKKYNYIDRNAFAFFIKEYEFRFNYGSPKEQLKILIKWTEL